VHVAPSLPPPLAEADVAGMDVDEHAENEAGSGGGGRDVPGR